MLEVEIKAKCGPRVEDELTKLGAEFINEELQEDVYLNAPNRDFEQTDEALRIRKINYEYFLTYKGPKTETTPKVREEIEIPTHPKIADIFKSLGFREVATVRKRRRTFRFEGFSIVLDEAENLGSFIEIESKKVEDRDRMIEILNKLGIKEEDYVKESYLELLLEKMKSA